VLAFTSPANSYVTADPGYESGTHAAAFVGARIVKVPLTKTYAHDVKAMLSAAPDAGVFYICNSNNPTVTMTSHSDIEYALANKPKGYGLYNSTACVLPHPQGKMKETGKSWRRTIRSRKSPAYWLSSAKNWYFANLLESKVAPTWCTRGMLQPHGNGRSW
jgi:hypothetical protein